MSAMAQWLAQGLDHLLPLTATYRTQEIRMALTDQALTDLDQATNDVAERLDELADQVESTDASVAAEIRTRADRLRVLAADPANPVPDEQPVDPNA